MSTYIKRKWLTEKKKLETCYASASQINTKLDSGVRSKERYESSNKKSTFLLFALRFFVARRISIYLNVLICNSNDKFEGNSR